MPESVRTADYEHVQLLIYTWHRGKKNTTLTWKKRSSRRKRERVSRSARVLHSVF